MTRRLATVTAAAAIAVAALAAVAAPASNPTVSVAELPVIDLAGGDLQQRYDDARYVESTVRRPVGRAGADAEPCEGTADHLLRLARFARRGVEWIDRGDDPVNGALASAMTNAATGARDALQQGACDRVGRGTGGPLPDAQPLSRSIWDRTIRLSGLPAAAERAEIEIDGSPIGSVRVVGGEIHALGPVLEPGPHVVRVTPDDGNPTVMAGVFALPGSAFAPAAGALRLDPAMSRRLEAIEARHGGAGAAYVLDVASGVEGCTVAAGDRFPAASLLKLPVMVAGLSLEDQQAQRYEIATIGGWSSNVGATRLIELVGDAAVGRRLLAMGATDSTFAGVYTVGTASTVPSACPDAGRDRGGSNKLTTARDVGAMLRSIAIAGTSEPTPNGEEILASLLASERAGDNGGIGLAQVDGAAVAAVKNGWIDPDLYHTAAIAFLDSGPRIVVVLTSGLDRGGADAFANDVFAAALGDWPATGDAPDEGSA